MDSLDFQNAEERYYEPSGSYEYYVDGQFFNASGDPLRDPEEYNDCAEGYTPFGDE